MNKKSDVKAKQAFCNCLTSQRGFDSASITASPADITAVKDGQIWYFEIKMTKQAKTYFGAATATEWEQAFKTPERYRFVIAVTDEDETKFEFIEFTPEQFMAGSTIPPIKIYFNIDLKKKEVITNKHRDGTVSLSKETFETVHEAYKKCKN